MGLREHNGFRHPEARPKDPSKWQGIFRVAQDDGGHWLLWLAVALLAFCLIFPVNAHAQAAFNNDQIHAAFDSTPPSVPSPGSVADIPTPDQACSNVNGLTKVFVKCIKGTILYAVYEVVGPISYYMARTVAVCITLAITLWGAMVLTGRAQALKASSFILFIKIGLVGMTTWYFGNAFGSNGLFPAMLDVMEDLITMVTQYAWSSPTLQCGYISDWNADQGTQWEVWDLVDCTLDTLIGGVFSDANLSSGIVGFLVASLFSPSPGILIATMGVTLIGLLIFAIFRAVYIFLSAYIGFSLMVLISPFFIPLVLFGTTKGYFDKWLKITIGFIPTPLFVMAYLTMMLSAFDTVMYTSTDDNAPSLYTAITGGNVGNNVSPSADIGEWLDAQYDPKGQKALGPQKLMSQEINTSPADLMKLIKVNGAEVDTASLDEVGALVENSVNDLKNEIFNFPGFSVGAQVTTVDWGKLAQAAYPDSTPLDPSGNPDPTGYLGKIMMSFIMAILVSYIFYSMLEYMPFIGAGIANELLTMGTLGVGKMAPPGDKAAGGMSEKMENSLTSFRTSMAKRHAGGG